MKLNELTPPAFVCSDCKTCPAVFETENNTYVIIGKRLSDADLEQLKHRVGNDEFVIEVPKGMIDGAIKI